MRRQHQQHAPYSDNPDGSNVDENHSNANMNNNDDSVEDGGQQGYPQDGMIEMGGGHARSERRVSTSSNTSSVGSDDDDDDSEIMLFPGTDYQASIRPSTIKSYFTKDRMIFFAVGFAIALLVAAMSRADHGTGASKSIPQKPNVEDATTTTTIETNVSNLTKVEDETSATAAGNSSSTKDMDKKDADDGDVSKQEEKEVKEMEEEITKEIEQDEKDNVTAIADDNGPHHGIKHVRFVPYPHNDIGLGSDEAGCDWTTVYGIKDEELKSSLLGGHTVFETTDLIQKRALTDSICLPRHPTYQKKLHIFSTKQARTCLENITLLITGDSYTKQLYIGLGEILLGVPSPVPSDTDPFKSEMQGHGQREQVRKQMEKDLELIGINDQTLLWECDDYCDGRKHYPFYNKCGYCLNGLDQYMASYQRQHPTATPKTIVPVVGAGVHIYLTQEHNNVSSTIAELKQFADYAKHGIILVSPQPWESTSVYDELQYHPNVADNHDRFENVYWEMLPFVKQQRKEYANSVHKEEMKLRYLDVFQATGHCSMKNCSYDTGGHRSRFVNRWKAQLLLNTLCTYIP